MLLPGFDLEGLVFPRVVSHSGTGVSGGYWPLGQGNGTGSTGEHGWAGPVSALNDQEDAEMWLPG